MEIDVHVTVVTQDDQYMYPAALNHCYRLELSRFYMGLIYIQPQYYHSL